MEVGAAPDFKKGQTIFIAGRQPIKERPLSKKSLMVFPSLPNDEGQRQDTKKPLAHTAKSFGR